MCVHLLDRRELSVKVVEAQKKCWIRLRTAVEMMLILPKRWASDQQQRLEVMYSEFMFYVCRYQINIKNWFKVFSFALDTLDII